MPYDVFISHSSYDKTTADAVCAKLEADGIRCWIAPRDILGSESWPAAIFRATQVCRVMVLVFSQKSNDSEQVQREINLAAKNGLAILPFRIEAIEPTGAAGYFLFDRHWLDALTLPLETHIAQLSRTVRLLLERLPEAKPQDKSVMPAEIVPAPPVPAKLFTSAKLLLTLSGHTKYVISAAFSPDGSLLATGSLDGTAKIWDVATGTLRRTLYHSIDSDEDMQDVESVDFSWDSKRVVTGGRDGTAKVWDVATGRRLVMINAGSSLNSAAFSPDGQCVLTGGAVITEDGVDTGGTVALWDATKGICVRPLTGQTLSVNSVAFSSDGKRIVTGSSDNTAKVWDMDTGKELMTFVSHSNGVCSAAFSPDGSHIVTGSTDKTAKVWDVMTGEVLMTLVGESGYVWSAASSPDAIYIVTSNYNNTVKVWDAASGKELFTLTGHSEPVTSVSYSSDGRYIVTSSWDKTAKVWELE